MYMNEDEIVGKFKRADNKKEILQILADLNGCRVDDIRAYLLEHGFSEDDLPAKRGRKKKVDNDKTEARSGTKGNDDPHIETEKKAAQLMEIPELTEKEQSQVARALAIPIPVIHAVSDRIEILTEKITELENERECLHDYLEGVVCSEAG